MASFTSFTISQPFLGAPLHFFPALGSEELDSLIDAYVPGHAPLSTKFSEVTIDFYNNAIVDLSTGALVKHYDVFPAFDFDESLAWAFDSTAASVWDSPPMSLEQSPEQFLSNDFDFGMDSPVLFTPSPGSSASASFSSADFDFGSASFTSSAAATQTAPSAPARVPTRDSVSTGRVTKKYAAKKETKKAVSAEAEARLPGFSIMTKDGVDVTNSAGRGTKTKEQREHAHLMRIMKACDSCKKKKVKCDPSHPRPSISSTSSSPQTTTTSMSRTSSTSTSYSPGLIQQSPPGHVPGLKSSQSGQPRPSIAASSHQFSDGLSSHVQPSTGLSLSSHSLSRQSSRGLSDTSRHSLKERDPSLSDRTSCQQHPRASFTMVDTSKSLVDSQLQRRTTEVKPRDITHARGNNVASSNGLIVSSLSVANVNVILSGRSQELLYRTQPLSEKIKRLTAPRTKQDTFTILSSGRAALTSVIDSGIAILNGGSLAGTTTTKPQQGRSSWISALLWTSCLVLLQIFVGALRVYSFGEGSSQAVRPQSTIGMFQILDPNYHPTHHSVDPNRMNIHGGGGMMQRFVEVL